MINLPLTDNTVCSVERAVRDRYNDHVKNDVYWLEHLGEISPTPNERLALLDALFEYSPEEG